MPQVSLGILSKPPQKGAYALHNCIWLTDSDDPVPLLYITV